MVHSFAIGQTYIALDSASGAVHVLSPLAYEMLPYVEKYISDFKKCPTTVRYSLPKYSADDVAEAYSELRSLYEDGILFSADPDVAPPNSPVIKSMCLHIANDCNMRCAYCFADGGDYKSGRKLMSLETAKAALDYTVKSSAGIHNLEVDFFGGEPLLNYNVVKETVAYGRELEKKFDKNIRFTMTTNGTLLDDEKIDFINREMYNVVLSVDGMKSTNDKMRTFSNGAGTYDIIIPKYKKLVSGRPADKSWYVRGTFTRENLNFCDDVLHLVDLGFDQVSVEPVVLPASDPLSIREEDLPQIFAEYEKLAMEIVRRGKEGRYFNFFHFMIDLDAGPCIYKRIKGCGSGTEYIAITTDGEVFPCHQFVSYPQFKLGDIENGVVNKELREEFFHNNIIENETCKKCFAKYFCGGGCAANNFGQNNDMKIPYEIACKIERKRVECALYIKAELS